MSRGRSSARPAHGIGRAPRGRRLAEWALLRGLAPAEPRRLRAVHPPPRAARRAPRGRRPADEHLAGLQLPGRRRRRSRRHLVRDYGTTTVDGLAPVPEPRRPAALPPLRPAASCTGSTARASAPTSSRRPTSTPSTTARSCAAYDLIVFPGHHEYVTEREYDAVERFRDLGGNLAFLSANNFFWRVDVKATRCRGSASGASSAGRRQPCSASSTRATTAASRRGPWLVRRRPRPLAVRRDGLAARRRVRRRRDRDRRHPPSSPEGTPGRGRNPGPVRARDHGQMTYYETQGGEGFAAGAFSLAGATGSRK